MRRRPPRTLLFHSDRGVQYTSHAFCRALELRGIRQSMSRKGNGWHNAVAESFFAPLKQELVQGRRSATTKEARRSETAKKRLRCSTASLRRDGLTIFPR